MDTIFALASGVGRAGIAVIRVSGNRTGEILVALAGKVPPPRRASLRRLHSPSGELLDDAIVLWFPEPASYTGESCAELHLHGGPAVIAGISDALVELGLRPAEPGEFTKRAFLNGRMDLTEAEAVIDVIEAETAAQRDQAIRQLGGALSQTFASWRGRLLHLLAQQEALVDFPDDDLPPDVEDNMETALADLGREIRSHLNDGRRGERLRTGVNIVVTGAPNVGKSSLVNSLVAREVAIVAPTPGTTRDVLEARLVVSGVPVTLVDTAGLRDTDDPIEAEGVRRARARTTDADIILYLVDRDTQTQASETVSSIPPTTIRRPAGNEPSEKGPVVLEIVSKADRQQPRRPADARLRVSALTGQGMDHLRDRLANTVLSLTKCTSQAPLTRARHRSALLAALAHLDHARDLPAELRAEELRLALRSLGRVTGHVGVEEVLGQIFSQFCIGK